MIGDEYGKPDGEWLSKCSVNITLFIEVTENAEGGSTSNCAGAQTMQRTFAHTRWASLPLPLQQPWTRGHSQFVIVEEMMVHICQQTVLGKDEGPFNFLFVYYDRLQTKTMTHVAWERPQQPSASSPSARSPTVVFDMNGDDDMPIHIRRFKHRPLEACEQLQLCPHLFHTCTACSSAVWLFRHSR